jgi:hypothetical protein
MHGIRFTSRNKPGDGYVTFREQHIISRLHLFHQVSELGGCNFHNGRHGGIIQLFQAEVEWRFAFTTFILI